MNRFNYSVKAAELKARNTVSVPFIDEQFRKKLKTQPNQEGIGLLQDHLKFCKQA
jgi:hypothetical protein